MTEPSSPPLPETHRIELPDGRAVAYLDAGDPDGYPVVSQHGGLSCRLDVAPADAAARAHGLRLIAPDRPGIGRSDPKAGHTVAGWADDVGDLMDHLGVDHFATVGWSFGGAFAQAVAHGQAHRVDHLTLVASVIPPDWPGMQDEIDRMDRVFHALTHHRLGRFTERSILHLMSLSARHAPKAFGRSAGVDAAHAEVVAAAIAEGTANGAGVVTEYQVVNAPWGFDPSQIAVPTHVWQGDADDLVPPDWGHRLHDAIDGSTLTVVPGASHFLWYDHWDDLFASITAATRP